MKQEPQNLMTLFKVTVENIYKFELLRRLSELGLVHIKSKYKDKKEKSSEPKDSELNKIKKLRELLDNLFTKLNVNVADFKKLKENRNEKAEIIEKNLKELIDHTSDEINFYLNRVTEVEKYIVKAKIELDQLKTLKIAYLFLNNYSLNKNSLSVFNKLAFKEFVTFEKNLNNLYNVFKFEDFPCVYQVNKITENRIIFFIVYLNEREDDLFERINIIHAEEILILKKYLTPDGINFSRINNEIEIVENDVLKYQKELTNLHDEHLLKFAAISENLRNMEKLQWAQEQYEEVPPNQVLLNFFALTVKKNQIKQTLKDEFGNKISIDIIDIPKQHPIYDKIKLKIDTALPKEGLKETSKDERRGTKESEEKEEPEEKGDLRQTAPTIMHHNRFIRPFETLTKMYGTPSYSEIDPTPFLFITFPLLFGLMFGDMGHGIVLIISGFVGSKVFKKKGGDIYNLCWIIFTCGWWAILWGFLYGEFFGMNFILGYELKPFIISIPFVGSVTFHDPLNNIMALFLLTLFIGVIHINLGWLIQFANFSKQKMKFKAVSDPLMKILFLDGGVGMLVLYGLNINSWVAYPYPVLLCIIPGILLILMKPLGKLMHISYLKKESFKKLLGEGSIETFETVLSIPSNILSYIRLLALALAHISLMLAIEAMIGIIPRPSPQSNLIGFILIEILVVVALIFGNLIVILLEGVLVFLNAIRLHFYEFFFKFYQGAGLVFVPFSLSNEFSQIKFKADVQKDIISETLEKEINLKMIKSDIKKARQEISKDFF